MTRAGTPKEWLIRVSILACECIQKKRKLVVGVKQLAEMEGVAEIIRQDLHCHAFSEGHVSKAVSDQLPTLRCFVGVGCPDELRIGCDPVIEIIRGFRVIPSQVMFTPSMSMKASSCFGRFVLELKDVAEAKGIFPSE